MLKHDVKKISYGNKHIANTFSCSVVISALGSQCLFSMQKMDNCVHIQATTRVASPFKADTHLNNLTSTPSLQTGNLD